MRIGKDELGRVLEPEEAIGEVVERRRRRRGGEPYVVVPGPLRDARVPVPGLALGGRVDRLPKGRWELGGVPPMIAALAPKGIVGGGSGSSTRPRR